MRILVLSNLYPPHFIGGYELICRTVVEALRERGHSLRVLTSDHVCPGVTPRQNEPEVERTLKIHGFYGHPWLRIGQLRHLERENNGIFKAALARFKPELIYVWNMGGLSKSLLLTLQAMGLPSVFYISDHWIARGLLSDVWLNWWNNPAPGLRQRLLRETWIRVGYRERWHKTAPTNPVEHLSFQRIYFCSRALKELTAAAGFDVGHGAVIYCPINRMFTDSEPRPVSDSFSKLLYAGRLAPDKGIMTALEAFRLLKGKFNGTLRICGGGEREYVRQLQRFANEHTLPVTFTSAGIEEMPAVYREHDGLLFTSEWQEPFALTPLEGMACGLPVIATTTGGSAELFRHGQNALVYQAGNAAQLAERILEFSENGELRKQCATAGCQEVRERCAEPVILDQIEKYLEETLKSWELVPLPPLPA